MNFLETLESLDLSIKSNSVPLIIGESGIGKTSLIKKYCKDNDLNLVTIDANLLKEGEIGGLPTVVNNRTIYATHTKLIEVEEKTKNNEKCLLFIDEINRCDHSVQQELMNLILNREINGFRLNERVIVASAMNPSSKLEEFRDTNYQVVDMDPAQEDRFVWLKMDSDSKEWILWGIGEGNIHPKVIEFISSFQDYLKMRSRDEHIEATPRSWERISNALKVFDKENNSKNENKNENENENEIETRGNEIKERTLYNFVKGNVGTKIAQDFITYLQDNKNSNLKVKDIFDMEILNQIIKDEISESSHSKLYILAMNLVREASKDEAISPKKVERISEIIALYPKDLRISIMKEIKEVYKNGIYNNLLDNDLFIESFFQCYI